MNEIVFPAAILQPPFFDMNADDAVNYGGIGAVIGHEIGHGFDDQGSKYDGEGNLKSWWTDEDRRRFEARTAALIDQYDAFEALPGEHVNGALTIGENIGDLGGLSIAYMAYHMSLNGKDAPVIDGLSGDQRLFTGWAQVWRRNYTEENLLSRLKVDPHSPSEFRCNGIVRNIDAWYAAFDVGPNDAMYLAPENRVKIW
jgi:predicted metalloendopeptidase